MFNCAYVLILEHIYVTLSLPALVMLGRNQNLWSKNPSFFGSSFVQYNRTNPKIVL